MPKVKLTSSDKITLIFLFIVLGLFFSFIFWLFYEPVPERYYFVDMWEEQRAEYNQKQAEKNN